MATYYHETTPMLHTVKQASVLTGVNGVRSFFVPNLGLGEKKGQAGFWLGHAVGVESWTGEWGQADFFMATRRKCLQ